MDWSALVPGLIPVVVPVAVYLLKSLVPKVPTVWLPVAAIALGAVADTAAHFATGSVANPILGAVLGAAGVGLREVVDQIRKAMTA